MSRRVLRGERGRRFPCGYMVEYLEHAPDDLWSEAFAIDDGFMHVPQVPGHGVDFSDDAKKRYMV